MKKIIILVLATMMLCTFVSCYDSATNDAKQGTLIVDGQTIPSHTTLYPEYATVSLCDVISALGFELSWTDTDRVSFCCNNIKYEICISEKTLVKEGKSDNYLICAPGNGHYVCDIYEGTLIIDDNTLHALFNTFINYPINIAIDQENQHVIITSK